jgi:hypothetical protein
MMKKVIFYFIVLAVTSTIISCKGSGNQQTENKTDKNNLIKKADWLIGEWKNISSEGIAIEIWTKQNDTTYFGKSFFVIGKDTVSSETINLKQIGNDLFYIPTVKNENNGQAIKFILTVTTENRLVFENPKHDFPQKISYTQITKDSIVAEISGIIEGKPNSQKFPMKKVK